MRSLIAVLAILVTACSSAAPSPSAPLDPSPGDAFTLRMWTTQALEPVGAFAQGSFLVIADGVLYRPGAVPAIYPGPLLQPFGARRISDAGITKILAEAQAAGLLGPRTDFTDGPIAGAITGHIALGSAAAPRELTGRPDAVMQCITTPCVPAPGTPEAFGGFWARLQDLDSWLGRDLGEEVLAAPERIALLVTASVVDPSLPGARADWPLDVGFDTAGAPFAGDATVRCVLLERDDLAAALPVLQTANQLTRWFDAAGLERGLVARVLLPGDRDPCAS